MNKMDMVPSAFLTGNLSQWPFLQLKNPQWPKKHCGRKPEAEKMFWLMSLASNFHSWASSWNLVSISYNAVMGGTG